MTTRADPMVAPQSPRTLPRNAWAFASLEGWASVTVMISAPQVAPFGTRRRSRRGRRTRIALVRTPAAGRITCEARNGLRGSPPSVTRVEPGEVDGNVLGVAR